MKKATILMVFLVFLASIMIVGMFGSKIMTDYRNIHCEYIILNSMKDENGAELNREFDANSEYLVKINDFNEEKIISFDYTVLPFDATDKSTYISITYDSGGETPISYIEDGKLYITAPGAVHVEIKALDSASTKAKIVINFYIKKG